MFSGAAIFESVIHQIFEFLKTKSAVGGFLRLTLSLLTSMKSKNYRLRQTTRWPSFFKERAPPPKICHLCVHNSFKKTAQKYRLLQDWPNDGLIFPEKTFYLADIQIWFYCAIFIDLQQKADKMAQNRTIWHPKSDKMAGKNRKNGFGTEVAT